MAAGNAPNPGCAPIKAAHPEPSITFIPPSAIRAKLFVNVARVTYDGQTAITADLSNKIIFWNCQGENRLKLREINLLDIGFIFDIKPTRLARFLVIKTTSKIILYEPK